jgi:hypothetical protein
MNKSEHFQQNNKIKWPNFSQNTRADTGFQNVPILLQNG